MTTYPEREMSASACTRSMPAWFAFVVLGLVASVLPLLRQEIG